MSVHGNSASGGAYQQNFAVKYWSLFRSSTITVVKNYYKVVVNLILPSSSLRLDEPLDKKNESMPTQDSYGGAGDDKKRVPVDAIMYLSLFLVKTWVKSSITASAFLLLV